MAFIYKQEEICLLYTSSKLYITTPNGKIVYGTAVAADTGGAIKGNKVDLYYNTYNECIQFGRRNVTVYVLN